MTVDELTNTLDKDIAWRKKEISELYLVCGNEDKEILRKSFLLILYSHWEGFIKNAAKIYLKYITSKKLKIGVLTLNYKTISIKQIIYECYKSQETLTLENEIKFMEKYEAKDKTKFQVKEPILDDKNSSIIDTSSNLSPGVFLNVCKVLGLSSRSSVLMRKNYLDECFLGSRNAISHGNEVNFDDYDEKFDLDYTSISELKDVVMCIMDNYHSDLLEYANRELYLEQNKSQRQEYDLSSDDDLTKKLEIISDTYREITAT